MAVSFVGAASAASDSVSLPSFSVGDVAFSMARASSGNPGVPSGWTQLGGSASVMAAYRVLQSGDTSVTWTGSVTHVGVVVYSGVHPIIPVDKTSAINSTGGSDTSYTAPAASNAYSTSIPIHMLLAYGANDADAISLSGWTNRTSSLTPTHFGVLDSGSSGGTISFTGTASYTYIDFAIRADSSYPQVADQDTKSGTVTSNSTSWTLTYPTNIAAGDLLLALLAKDGGNVAFDSMPSGWILGRLESGANAIVYAKKKAIGTESGNFTYTSNDSEQGAWIVYRIPATTWYGILGDAFASGGSLNGSVDVASTASSSLNPDPPSLDPVAWGAENTLWITACAVDTSRDITAYPSSPDTFTNTGKLVSGGSNGDSLGWGRLEKNASSVNPGTFTIASSDDWAASTIAVRPRQYFSVVAQTQAQIAAGGPTTTIVYAQSLSSIKATSLAPAQAQAQIVGEVRVYGQAQAQIVFKKESYAQALAEIYSPYKCANATVYIDSVYKSGRDTFTRSGSGLGTSDSMGTWVGSSGNPPWSTNGSVAIFSDTSGNYLNNVSYLPQLGSVQWEAYVDFKPTTIPISTFPSTDYIEFTIGSNVPGHYVTTSTIGLFPAGGSVRFYGLDDVLKIYAFINGVYNIYSTTYQHTSTYRLKVRTERFGSDLTVSVKIWDLSGSEPENWQVTTTEGLAYYFPLGMTFLGYEVAGTTDLTYVVEIDNFTYGGISYIAKAQSQTFIVIPGHYAQAQAFIKGWWSSAQAQSRIMGVGKRHAQAQTKILNPAIKIRRTYLANTVSAGTELFIPIQEPDPESILVLSFYGDLTNGSLPTISGGGKTWIKAAGEYLLEDSSTAIYITTGVTDASSLTQITMSWNSSLTDYHVQVWEVINANFSNFATGKTEHGGSSSPYSFMLPNDSSSSVLYPRLYIGVVGVNYSQSGFDIIDWGEMLATQNENFGAAVGIYLYDNEDTLKIENWGWYIYDAFASDDISGAYIRLDEAPVRKIAQAQAEIVTSTKFRYAQSNAYILQLTSSKYAQAKAYITQITVRNLVTFSDQTDQSSGIYTTGSFTPTANSFVLALIYGACTGANPIPSISGANLTWERIDTIEYDVTDTYGAAHLFKGTGDSTSGELTIDFGQAMLGAGWAVVEFVGADRYDGIRNLAKFNGLGSLAYAEFDPYNTKANNISWAGTVHQTNEEMTVDAIRIAHSISSSPPYGIGSDYGIIAEDNWYPYHEETWTTDTEKWGIFIVEIRKPVTRVHSQAQAQILTTGANIFRSYAQSNTDIKATSLAPAQAQADIKTTYQVYAQSLSHIKQTYQGYAQSNTWIKQTYQVYAQGQTTIKASDIKSYAQSQSQIKQIYQVYAQGQAQIKQTYQTYAQVQSQIKTTYRVYAQSLGQIKVTTQVWAQGQSQIKTLNNKVYAQSQVWIKKTYPFVIESEVIAQDSFTEAGSGTADLNTHTAEIGGTWSNTLGSGQFFINKTLDTASVYLTPWAPNVVYGLRLMSDGYVQGNVYAVVRDYAQSALVLRQIDSNRDCYYLSGSSYIIRSTDGVWTQISSSFPENGWTRFQVSGSSPTNLKVESRTTQGELGTGWNAEISDNTSANQASTGWIGIYGLSSDDGEPDYNDKYSYDIDDFYAVSFGSIQGPTFAQSQANILSTYKIYAQSQAKIKVTVQTYAQALGQIKATYQVYAQANAQISGVAATSTVYAQALTDIKQTYQTYAQSQAQIKQTYLVNSQALTNIKTSYLSCAQVLVLVKASSLVYGQSQGQIKQIYLVSSNAQARIKRSYLVYAQSQGQIKTIYYIFAQAQTQIKAFSFAYSNAQSRIKQTYLSYAQSLAQIKTSYNTYAQGQGQIKQVYQSYANTLGQIKSTYLDSAQAQTQVKQTYQVYAQGRLQIKQTYQAHAQASVDIYQYGRPDSDWHNPGGWLNESNSALNLWVSIDELTPDTNDYIKSTTVASNMDYDFTFSAMDNAVLKTNHRLRFIAQEVGSGTSTLTITLWQGKDPTGTLIATYTTPNLVDGVWNEYSYLLSEAEAATITDYNDLTGMLVANNTGAARARVAWLVFEAPHPSISTVHSDGQAQAQIKQVYKVYGQANTSIILSGLQSYAQSQSKIVFYNSLTYGQAQSQIKQTYQSYGQSQAKIYAFNIQAYAQSLAFLTGLGVAFAQAQAQIKTTYIGYAQANAQVKQTYQVYAQALGQIKTTYRGYGQSLANIKQTYQAYAQALSQVKTTYREYGQTQSQIKVTYQVYAQSQSQIKQAYQSVAQAQAQVKQSYQAYAQTLSQIKTYYRGYGQTQAHIKVTANYVCAQSMTQIKTTYQIYAQSQAQIKQAYQAYAQSLGQIKQAYQAYAQAQVQLSAAGVYYCAQALAQIYTPVYLYPISDVATNGWVGVVI